MTAGGTGWGVCGGLANEGRGDGGRVRGWGEGETLKDGKFFIQAVGGVQDLL